MEKSWKMDFEEWELLPDNRHSFVEFGLKPEKSLLFAEHIDTNYFSNENNSSQVIEEKEGCKDICVVPSESQIPMIVADHRSTASMVLFRKSKEDEFVDMKIESPKVSTREISMPPLEPEKVLFDSKEQQEQEEDSDKEMECEEPDMIKEKPSGLKLWSFTICSVGLAAATLCIFIPGDQQLQKQQHQKQKIQFPLYTDEKRIKQVMQQATRMNQALTAVRGVPMTRARVSFGGYYDGL